MEHPEEPTPLAPSSGNWTDLSKAAEGTGPVGAPDRDGTAPGTPQLTAVPPPCKMTVHPTDLTLRLLAVRRTGQPDPQLQAAVRSRLRLLEGDSREVAQTLGELSARLLSIHSDQDQLVVTFKTFQEIWKFSTYHALGFTHHCLESLLVDEAFWLAPPQGEEDPALQVLVDEEALRRVQHSLLVQEGPFFVLSADHQVRLSTAPAPPRRKAEAEQAEEAPPVALSSPNPCSPPGETPQLLEPFYQWALKGPWDPLEDLLGEPELPETPNLDLALGLATALTDRQASAPEEVSLGVGDQLELLGVQVPGLAWRLCRHTASGHVGFVRTCDIRTQNHQTEPCEDIFLSEEERDFFSTEASFSQEDAQQLLARTSGEDTSLHYTLDRLDTDEMEPQEQEVPTEDLHPEPQEILRRVKKVLEQCKSCQLCPEEPALWGLPSASAPSSPKEEEPPFQLDPEADWTSPEALRLLDAPGPVAGFHGLYALCPPVLRAAFPGCADEEELAGQLARVREAAKQAGLARARARLCCLLGGLCLRGLKLSQARVYLDEALAALAGCRGDLELLTAVFASLAFVLLRQRNATRCPRALPKAWVLLLGTPGPLGPLEPRAPLLRLALRGAMAAGSRWAEARACFLLVRLHLGLRQPELAAPFLERLLLLPPAAGSPWAPGAFLLLAATYGRACLPRLALGCLRAASRRAPGSLPAALRRVDLALGFGPPWARGLPAHLAPFLWQALTEGPGVLLTRALCASLARLLEQHGRPGAAAALVLRAAEAGGRRAAGHLLDLGRLLVLAGHCPAALDILEAVSEAAVAAEDQEGVAANVLGVALARTGWTQQAAERYYGALWAARTRGQWREQAVVLANLGMLWLRVGAGRLGQLHLLEAVRLFCRQPEAGGLDFSCVLLRLGRLLARHGHAHQAQCYLEWAFLVALDCGHLQGQLQAVQRLCDFHGKVLPDSVQAQLYLQFQLSLAQGLGDKALEARLLQALSQHYLALGTQRAYHSALDFTKRGLAVAIDLGDKAQEARGWLTAGRLYYTLRQRELVDLYVQVAQDTALDTGNTHLGLELFEAAGDIFFNGCWEREKAVSFYRDRALPLAVSTGSQEAELRLCNKLAALLTELDAPREGLEFAHEALALSVSLGHRLNERVACHRLGILHQRVGQAELAEHFYLKALALGGWPLRGPEDTLYYLRVYRALGDLVFHDLKDPLDAAGYYQLALAAAVDLGSKRAQERLCWQLASVHHHFLGDRDSSLDFYRRARAFASELRGRRACGRAPWAVSMLLPSTRTAPTQGP